MALSRDHHGHLFFPTFVITVVDLVSVAPVAHAAVVISGFLPRT